VTKDQHTSCSCNTGFVFFRDTCTATESVYLNVSGVLQLPLGEFRDAELKKILLDGLSAYLNYSKDFITISIGANNAMKNETDGNSTNVSSNSSSMRRLLFDLPLEFYFIALMQIEKDDKYMYAKIKNLTNDAVKTITDANGFQMLLNKAEFTSGYFTADGKPVSKCADGQNRIADFFNKLLFCDIRIPTVGPEEKPQLWWLWLVVGAACAAITTAVVLFRKKGHVPRQTAERQQTQQTTVEMARRSAMFPAKLLCPATVSFEYQLVPGHLI
jgi:hypothetical protein